MNFVDIWLCRKIKSMRYGEKHYPPWNLGESQLFILWIGKNSPFSFSCLAKSLSLLICSLEKGLIFSEKGLKIWREGLAAEERLLQNVKIEIENVLNSLLLPGSAENAPARRDHSETWQMPGYIKALTRTLNKVTMWASRFQTHWKIRYGETSSWGGPAGMAERMQDQDCHEENIWDA